MPRPSGPLVATVALAALAPGCAGECYPELDANGIVEVRIVERYTPDGPYLYEGDGLEVRGCAGRDALTVGSTFRLYLTRLRPTEEDAACRNYAAVLLDELGLPPGDPVERFVTGSVVSAARTAPSACGAPALWSVGARRPEGLDATPFDDVAIEGALPPFVIRRVITPPCTVDIACSDDFVAELRVLE